MEEFKKKKKKENKKKAKESKTEEETPSNSIEPEAKEEHEGDTSKSETTSLVTEPTTPKETHVTHESDEQEEDYKSTIADLSKEIENYKKKLSHLEEVNSNLKSENTNLKDQLNTAEARALHLKIKLDKVLLDRGSHPQNDDSDHLTLSPSSYNQDTSGYSIQNEDNLYSDSQNVKHVKQQLESWKGWQIDMRNWRTIGCGPVLEM